MDSCAIMLWSPFRFAWLLCFTSPPVSVKPSLEAPHLFPSESQALVIFSGLRLRQRELWDAPQLQLLNLLW